MPPESHIESHIESMTGFSEVRATISGIPFICRVKSLNHRFLDVKVRMPRADWTSLDIVVRKLFSQTFTRGSVELNLSVEATTDSNQVRLNTELAQNYLKLSQELATSAKLAPLSMDALFRLPGVVTTSGGSHDFDELLAKVDEKAILRELIEPALSALKAARLDEGTKLLTHFADLLTQMDSHLSAIKALEEPEKERLRQLISERAHETMKILGQLSSETVNAETFAARLREEAVFWIDRRDFDEERMRLGMHLKSFRELVESRTAVSGRKLEFLQQELLREVNTLGTKSQSTAITAHTIEMKTILERIKEQLANVA
jgi:uncharacterized protein (TIGR00255 family)